MEALLIDRQSSPIVRLVEPQPVLDQLPAAERINTLAGHLNAVNAAIVDVVAEVLDTGAWAVDGIRSANHWLCWQLGITTNEAQRLLALAAARDTHPVVSAIFANGQLSTTQAAIATSVDPTRDQEAAEVVGACTIPQLRLFTRAMRNSDDHARKSKPTDAKDTAKPTPTPAPKPAPQPSSTFEFWFGADGWLNGRFALDPESGRIVDQALRHARDLLFHQRNQAVDADTDIKVTGRRVSWADALVEVAHRFLDSDDSPARRERFRINLFMNPASDIAAEWADRSAVPDCLADKLTCDGHLTPVFVEGGKPVSVGRALRIVPDRTRRLVLHRDGHTCRIPWCERARWLDIHHIIHWKHGGPTDTGNLIAVCDHCHTAIHNGRLTISGDADDPHGLAFTDRHGNPIDYRTPTPPRPSRPPPQPNRPYIHPLGERLDHRDVWVNPSRATAT